MRKQQIEVVRSALATVPDGHFRVRLINAIVTKVAKQLDQDTNYALPGYQVREVAAIMVRQWLEE